MTTETSSATLEAELLETEETDGIEDVVEGPLDGAAGNASAGQTTVGEAASEYFEWSERREQQREKRAQKLAESRESETSPKPPGSRKTSPPFDKNARIAVTQFVSHVTPSLPVAELTPHGMAAFQETIEASAEDVAARLLPVKEFLCFCWKTRGYTDANLGNHLRVKTAAVAPAPAQIEHEEAERFEMTADGLDQLKENLERRKEELPAVIQALAQSREDGGISKSAPFTAARENHEQLTSQINALEYLIAHAVISKGGTDGRAYLGSTVGVRRLDAGGDGDQVQQYTLVGPTEVNAEQRRISVESPVGKGLINATVGTIVEIEVPRGTMRFEVVSVEG